MCNHVPDVFLILWFIINKADTPVNTFISVTKHMPPSSRKKKQPILITQNNDLE